MATNDISQVSTVDGVAAPSSLQHELASLQQRGIDRFDPVRFRYITLMFQRTLDQRESVAVIVEKKALTALADYQADFVRAREHAVIITDRVALQFPESIDRVQRLFGRHEFNGIKQLEKELKRYNSKGPLAELTQYILQDGSESHKPAKELSFDDVLRQQENDVVQLFADSESGLKQRSDKGDCQPKELKSVRLFRESWVKRSADKQVSQAIKEGPENAGPLNAQKLVIRSLSAMRDLSPAYLSRFMPYLDTLLWLEQAGKKREPVVAKKGRGNVKATSRN